MGKLYVYIMRQLPTILLIMEITSTLIPYSISTPSSSLSSDLDLHLFREPIETANSTDLELENPDLVLFQLALRMDITQATSSLSGINFMPSSPPPDPTGIAPWPLELVYDFIKYLEDESSNQSVLTSLKRNTIYTHLSNPNSRPPPEYTLKQRTKFNNNKHDALCDGTYEMQE
jgi:hypothetical protein